MSTWDERQKEKQELKKKMFKKRIQMNSKNRKQKHRKLAFVSTLILVITTIAPIFDGISIVQAAYSHAKSVYVNYKIEKMIEEDKAMPTEAPVKSGNFVAKTDVFPNPDIPDIFSFSVTYDFSDLKALDEMVFTRLSGHVREFQSRAWGNGEYDYEMVAAARLLEEKIENRDNLSSDEVINLYNELINKRIKIHERAQTSISAIALAQTEQDYADYLLYIYNSTNNGQINNECVAYALKSVENFILGMSYRTIDKPISDILYRMALSYDIIASMNSNNMSNKCEAYVMANTLYKLSLQAGKDNNHKYEAYYNIGNNYKTLFTILYQNPTLPGYDERVYYLNKAYENILSYYENTEDFNAVKKVYKPMSDICKSLTYYYWEQKDVQKADSFSTEYAKWKNLCD